MTKRPDVDHAKEELSRKRQEYFECKVVMKLLRAHGQANKLADFQAELSRSKGCQSMDLTWYLERFPDFPLDFVIARRFEGDPLPVWSDAFVRFTRTPAVATYLRECEKRGINDREKTVGLVFNSGAHYMILHNLDVKVGRRLERKLGSPPVLLQVHDLTEFLKAIKSTPSEKK